MASSAVVIAAERPHPHTPPPTADSPKPRTHSPVPANKTCLLPYIDNSRGTVCQSEAKGSPTPVTNDFLPPELVLSLRRQGDTPPRGGTRLPPAVARRTLQTKTTTVSGAAPVTGPPANVWHHASRRTRLKHLTDHPPCVCGAGRDISFLYDVPPEDGRGEGRPRTAIPDTLIPEEYHLVKHPGVLGLEFHDDPYTTSSEKHDHHMTIFPSMKPAGRHEAVMLKHTMDQMLLRAGIPRELEDTNLHGPTEMHNLLELVQKEQAIYNICFHELIRQVSVHCGERGELLAEIRRRYGNLLNRVPYQVKSLHDEVVAQRALDRRLTIELKRFKSRISSLTDELSDVREHDLVVTEQSRAAQENLSSALAESEKNANLLAEYHDLYELQRKRLEDQVGNLTLERELWQQACYALARRVAEEGNLQTVRRLQLCEKAWAKLAGHFAILLSNRDTQQLSEVQGCVQQWRGEVVGVANQLREMEGRLRERLVEVEKGLGRWNEEFSNIVGEGGVVGPPGQQELEGLWGEMRRWQEVLNTEAEQFTGDLLLGKQEEVKSTSRLVEEWTEVAVQLFTRHQPSDDAPHCSEQQTMLRLNSTIDRYLTQCGTRLAGENGVATGFIHLITPLETWDSKLSLLLGSDKKLPDSDWIKFRTLLREWLEQIHSIQSYIGHVQGEGGEEEESVSLEVLLGEVEKWQLALSYSIDSQDTRTSNQVSKLHSSLVRWMVQLLLALTGTSSQDEGEGAGLTTHPSDLKANYSALSDSLTSFTRLLTRSCTDTVREIVDRRRREGYADAEEEQAELRRVSEEAEEWTQLGGLLLEEAAGRGKREEKEGREEGVDGGTKLETQGEEEGEKGERKEEGEKGKEGEEEGAGEASELHKLPEEMSVIGVDDNIQAKSLQKAIQETEASPVASCSQLGLATEEVMPEGRGALKKDAEALVIALDETKQKLKEQEEATRQAEERAGRAEKELEDSRSQQSQLEAELQQLRTALEQSKGPSGRSSRASKAGGTVAKRTGRQSTVQPPSRGDSRKKL